MKFTIRAENFEVTPAIRNYIEEKVSKIERYFNEQVQASAHINLKVNGKDNQKAEVTITMSDLVFRAEAVDQDIYAAIDAIVGRLERQIRKHKTKVNRKFREKGHAFDYIVPELSETDEVEQDELTIERVKRFELIPMDAEEAILQMNLLGHDFFLFMDGETGKTSAVYKRTEHSYGVIETN